MTGEPGFAPAKINLFLRVWPPGPDGFHPLQSWMVFAGVGDALTLVEGGVGLSVTGPFASGVPLDGSNLALRARDAFLAAAGSSDRVGVRLEKNLPPASGIGGGSSDAAAVLRLMQARSPIAEENLQAVARSLGADVPACLKAQGLMAEGRGEILSPAPVAPSLPAVLVNPGVGISTPDVFRAFDAWGEASGQFERRAEYWPRWSQPGPVRDVAEAVAMLAAIGNDLQHPAEILGPEVLQVIRALEADRRCRLARMSGSGATCFALCLTIDEARALEADIANAHPHWWVRATFLA